MVLLNDLLCNEDSVAPLADESCAPSAATMDAAEVLDMMLQQEAREGRVQRNAKYLADVQRHGMEATWRRKICHWMFETGKAFELAKDTVGCAIHFMDQYLSITSVDKIMLQLLSMVCMYVASKMHESQPISMDEMDLLSQRKFSRDDIRRVESQLVQVLGWRLAPPTSFTFARDFIQTLDVPDKQELEDQALHFLMDVIEDYGSLRFKNSSIGISAVHVVWNALRLRPSTIIKDAIHVLDLDASEFVDCYRWLRELRHSKHQQPRFISVEEPKIDPSRSISPTSVEDAAFAICHDVQDPELVESVVVTSTSEKRKSSSPPSEDSQQTKRAVALLLSTLITEMDWKRDEQTAKWRREHCTLCTPTTMARCVVVI